MLGNVSWPGTVVSKCLNKRGSVSDPTMSGWTQNLPLRQWGRTGQACHMHTWGPGEVDARSKPPPDARESKRAEHQRWPLFLQVPASLPGTLGANDSLQVSGHHTATLPGLQAAQSSLKSFVSIPTTTIFTTATKQATIAVDLGPCLCLALIHCPTAPGPTFHSQLYSLSWPPAAPGNLSLRLPAKSLTTSLQLF